MLWNVLLPLIRWMQTIFVQNLVLHTETDDGVHATQPCMAPCSKLLAHMVPVPMAVVGESEIQRFAA